MIIVILLICCAGCSSETSSRVISKRYTKDGVSIRYPALQGASKTVNSLIKDEAKKALDYYANTLNELSLTVGYKIKLLTNAEISIVYSGTAYVKGAAHPNALFYTTNINLKTGKKIRLKDFTSVDTAFVDKLKKAAKSQLPPKLFQAFQNYDDEQLMKYLGSADTLDYGVDNQYDTFSYLMKDSIGISLPVGHAVGDHLEIEVFR